VFFSVNIAIIYLQELSCEYFSDKNKNQMDLKIQTINFMTKENGDTNQADYLDSNLI